MVRKISPIQRQLIIWLVRKPNTTNSRILVQINSKFHSVLPALILHVCGKNLLKIQTYSLPSTIQQGKISPQVNNNSINIMERYLETMVSQSLISFSRFWKTFYFSSLKFFQWLPVVRSFNKYLLSNYSELPLLYTLGHSSEQNKIPALVSLQRKKHNRQINKYTLCKDGVAKKGRIR